MSGKQIAKAFRSATRNAGDKAISAGHTIVVKRGRQIVSIDGNGESRVIRSLDRAYVKNSAKTYKIK